MLVLNQGGKNTSKELSLSVREPRGLGKRQMASARQASVSRLAV